MNLAALFIKRPITTTLITLGMVVFGIMSYRVLPVADLPAIDFPTISVNASLPGASPETMASAVALPLEKQFSTISGLTSMNSTNTQGSTSITLQFDLSRDIDAAAQDVQTMIARGHVSCRRRCRPAVVHEGESRRLSSHALVMRSPSLPLSTVNDYADPTSAAHLHGEWRCAGERVRTSEIRGPHRRRSAEALRARHGIDEVVTACNRRTSTCPRHDGRAIVLHGARDGQLECCFVRPDVNLVQKWQPVRLGDVARVYDGVEQDKTASWYQGVRNISLMIQKQPGSNVVQVVDDIKALLPSVRAQLPPSVPLDVRMDRSESIRESVHDVKLTLLIALVLVIAVIFVFLRSFTATIIPSLTLPVSLIATFAVNVLLKYSLENLSLMALTLCIGFVVRRHDRHARTSAAMEMGSPHAGGVRWAKEVDSPSSR